MEPPAIPGRFNGDEVTIYGTDPNDAASNPGTVALKMYAWTLVESPGAHLLWPGTRSTPGTSWKPTAAFSGAW